MTLEKPRFYIAAIDWDNLPLSSTIQEPGIVNSHLKSHLGRILQSKIFSEGTAVSGNAPLEGFSPKLGCDRGCVQLQPVGRNMISEIGREASVVFTQITVVGESGTWIENSSVTKISHSGLLQVFGTAQLEKQGVRWSVGKGLKPTLLYLVLSLNKEIEVILTDGIGGDILVAARMD
jgi:hypothetical protein